MRRKVTEYIIHADDFGQSVDVNACIDECFRRNWLSEASIMVNMPGCNDAIRLASKRMGGNDCEGYKKRIGLHLNLTQGYPLTKMISKCPRFCSDDGTFNALFQGSIGSRFFLTPVEKKAVAQEIEAQLRKFVSIGGVMMQLDSHHHVHTNWSIWGILKPLAMKYGIKVIRISANLHKVNILKAVYKCAFNANIRLNFRATDYFDGVCEKLLNCPCGSVEVMTHPIFRDGIICDTDVPFDEQYEKLKAVSNSVIRKP